MSILAIIGMIMACFALICACVAAIFIFIGFVEEFGLVDRLLEYGEKLARRIKWR